MRNCLSLWLDVPGADIIFQFGVACMELLEVSVSVKPLPINEGGFEMDLVSVPRRLGSEGLPLDLPVAIAIALKISNQNILALLLRIPR